jgi:hypothetical protein
MSDWIVYILMESHFCQEKKRRDGLRGRNGFMQRAIRHVIKCFWVADDSMDCRPLPRPSLLLQRSD